MRTVKYISYYDIEKSTYDLAIFAVNKALSMGHPVNCLNLQLVLWDIDGEHFREYGQRCLADQWTSSVFGPRIDGIRKMFGLWGSSAISRPIEAGDYEPPSKEVRDIVTRVLEFWNGARVLAMRKCFRDTLPDWYYEETTSSSRHNIPYPLSPVAELNGKSTTWLA